MAKTSFRSKFNRFFYKNRNKGIRNLMLYLAIGNAVVYLLTMASRAETAFYQLLSLVPDKVLAWEVWRLVTYPLCFVCEHGLLFGVIGMLFYYWCGTILEQYWGTLRFNLYYLSGIVLTDIAAMLLGISADIYYVNMSLFLAVATVIPEQQIRIYFIIPVKMKWLAWLDLGLTLVSVIPGIVRMIALLSAGKPPYLNWLIALVPIVNYLLFFGKQAAGILPDFLRYHPKRKSWKRQTKSRGVYVNTPRAQDGARFRCTVCGRTERTNPGLEFRYCSKCAGYRCYCQDHIHNHVHITE